MIDTGLFHPIIRRLGPETDRRYCASRFWTPLPVAVAILKKTRSR